MPPVGWHLHYYGDSQPTCYDFRTPNLPGCGECVKNNAESL